MARQYAKTPAVKRTILEACVVAFRESGFHGVSMAEVARRAGISHTGLLHHFPRKEDLLRAVLALQDERAAEYLAQSEQPLDGGDEAVEIIREMIGTLADWDQHVGLIELAATLAGEASTQTHPAHEHFAERYRGIRRYLTRLFVRLEEEGRLSSSLGPEELAVATIALTDGLRIQWLYERGATLPREALAEKVLAHFLPDLDTKPATLRRHISSADRTDAEG